MKSASQAILKAGENPRFLGAKTGLESKSIKHINILSNFIVNELSEF